MKSMNPLFVVILVFLALFPGCAMAQNVDTDHTVTMVAETSADNVWDILKKMDDIDKYAPNIARVEWSGPQGEGGERTCYTPDGNGYFIEKITAYDNHNRSYSYALLEGAPVRNMTGSFNVVDLGYHKSIIIWTGKYEAFMENPQMTEEQFVAFLDQSATAFIDNVARAAEEKGSKNEM